MLICYKWLKEKETLRHNWVVSFCPFFPSDIKKKIHFFSKNIHMFLSKNIHLFFQRIFICFFKEYSSVFFKEYSSVFFSYVYPFISCFENSEFSGSVQKSLSHVLLLLYYVLSLLHINWDQPVQMSCPSVPILSINLTKVQHFGWTHTPQPPRK